jgi:uroporphyrinogen decarboxylase
MRQAGRYLPEYRELRGRAADFMELCLSPALAAEATMQPVRRFGMDAAIIFSDILMVPYALGRGVVFREGEGPLLEPIESARELCRLEGQPVHSRLERVFEAVRRVAGGLDRETALIGFSGAPWTLAVYLVEGAPSRDFRRVKTWAYGDAPGFAALIEIVSEAAIAFLCGQIEAGAEAVQLFDSWAGVLPAGAFERWVIEPTARIVAAVKRRHPHHPIIGYPRGAGLLYERYVGETGIDAIACDTAVPTSYARASLQTRLPVQGNLDPVMLFAGEEALLEAVEGLWRVLGKAPYVFNLGHGVLAQTPPEAVAALAAILRKLAPPA